MRLVTCRLLYVLITRELVGGLFAVLPSLEDSASSQEAHALADQINHTFIHVSADLPLLEDNRLLLITHLASKLKHSMIEAS